jgi:putative hemolysin
MSHLPVASVPDAGAQPSAHASVIDDRLKAFISEETSGLHIVDVLINERCPSFVKHWTWPAVRPVVRAALDYRKALKWADDIAALPTGQACFEYLDRALDLKVKVLGAENIPAAGRSVVISNHPTGLADGPAVLSALRAVRSDVEVMANADACRINQAFADVIVPVEWVKDKRTPAKTRETLRRTGASLAAGGMMLIFPSGALAQRVKGELVDRPWHSTAVSLARKNKAPVTPLHVKSRNSRLYYLLCDVHKELRDITLFHELMNKQGTEFELTFGPPIPWEKMAGDPDAVTDKLRAYVEHQLPGDPERVFEG